MTRLDIIIFGATGFTGKHVAMECARIAKKKPNLTWGIAGRSQSKLNAVLDEASKKTGIDLSSIPVVIADVADEQSLKEMCRQAKVVVNCCGPYRDFGKPVVEAALDSGAHYVDVSGEPLFMESMQLQYNDAARDIGVYVISACGFDSIPNDMGVIFLQQNFKGTLNSVESYISTDLPSEYQAEARRSGVINYGTWASIIGGISSRSALAPLRKQLYPTRMQKPKPILKKRGLIHRRDGSCALPFPGSDASVVYRTQRSLLDQCQERPVQFQAYVHVAWYTIIPMMLVGSIVLFLSLFQWGRNLLLAHPRFFTFGLVSRDQVDPKVMDNTHFSMTLYGEGWDEGADLDKKPNKRLTAKVSGTNPGYGATVVALLHSALTILEEKDKMPGTGGVMTTGYAFRNTSLVKRLHENNLKFEIIDQ